MTIDIFDQLNSLFKVDRTFNEYMSSFAAVLDTEDLKSLVSSLGSKEDFYTLVADAPDDLHFACQEALAYLAVCSRDQDQSFASKLDVFLDSFLCAYAYFQSGGRSGVCSLSFAEVVTNINWSVSAYDSAWIFVFETIYCRNRVLE